MATRMLQRRGTAAEWSAANPVLGAGEIGYTTDTKVVKVGDGVTAWNTLVADVLTRSIMDATGDLIVGNGADSVTRLARGATGQVLAVKADGTLEWVNPYSVVDAAEDLIVGAGADSVKRVAKGTIGHRLSVKADGTVGWEALPNSFTIVDAKGDLIVATANDTVTRVPVGNNDQVLVADSTQASGVRWATPASGASFGFAEVFLHGGG